MATADRMTLSGRQHGGTYGAVHVELTLEAAGLVGTRQPHVGYSQRSSSAWRLQIARQHGGKYGDVHELPLD